MAISRKQLMKEWNVTVMKNNSLLDKFINPCVTSLPKCEFCKKYTVGEEKDTCEAFPQGIQMEVMWEPEEKECNNGIYFEEE